MRSRGAPWRPARSTPAPAVLSRRPRGGARPPRLCRRFRGFGLRWLHPVGAPLRPSVRLSARLGPLLPVCCSPGPRPGASRFPGVPRPGSVVRFAAARPPTSPRAGRGGGGGAPVALPLPPTSPPRRAPHPAPVGSARVRVGSPGLPAAGRSPCPRRPASPAPLGPGGRTDAAGASAVPGVVRPGGVDPGPVSRGRRRGGAGLATGAGGGVEEESGPPPSSPRFLHAVAAAAARRDPRGTRVRCAMGAPSPRVGGRGGRSSVRPVGRVSRPLLVPASSPRGSSGSRVASRATLDTPPAPGPPGSSCSLPYLVDPASSICLSQRLSHACLSTHGRYSETANGSLNQLWFLWSLAPLLLG